MNGLLRQMTALREGERPQSMTQVVTVLNQAIAASAYVL
jgi:cytochrome c553